MRTHAEPAAKVHVQAASGQLLRCGGVQCPPGTCDHDSEQEVQRWATGPGPAPSAVPASVQQVLASSGSLLGDGVRAPMEARFGHSFTDVRVHTDEAAARSAEAIHAHAYTFGRHVVMGAGRWQPHTPAGRKLLAHELTHVVQQSGSNSSPSQATSISNPHDPAEHEAEHRSDETVRGRAIRPDLGGLVDHDMSRTTVQGGTGAGVVQRTPAPTTAVTPIVPDQAPLSPGQMRHSEFLDRLEAALVIACDEEMRAFGRSAKDCPTILKTFQRLRGQPVSATLRLARAFTKASASSDAAELLAAVVRRARPIARKVGEQTARSTGHVHSAADPQAASHPAREAHVVRKQLGTGAPLDPGVRARMEAGFGTGFDNVRIHSDESAARLAKALGAQAFTVGSDIAFASGLYRPGYPGGDQLLAHELAHTVQQAAGGAAAPADVHRDESDAEEAARSVAEQPAAAKAAKRLTRTGPAVRRLPAVLAAGLVVAEATPEIIIVSEVGADVVLVDGALTAAPAVLESTAPVILESTAPAVLEATVPTALEATAPLLETATTTSTAVSSSTLATTALAAGAAVTLKGDSGQEEKTSRCRSEPTPDPLPISWPAQLPYPDPLFGPLQRTPSADLEWMGIGRGEDQSRLAREIREARNRLLPPPRPCFDYDADPNAPYDAHHRHPLYLGGQEAEGNLCALRADRHQIGHPRLDNQSEHLPVYLEHGICSPLLRMHPPYQTYEIVASK